MGPVRWGVLGAANIARSVIEANRGSAVTSFVAVASRIVVPDPWICRSGGISLRTAAGTEVVPVEQVDAYRIEFDVVSAAIASSEPLEFGREDAVEQAAVLSALARSAATGVAVELG